VQIAAFQVLLKIKKIKPGPVSGMNFRGCKLKERER
jgi:hypothetical protein